MSVDVWNAALVRLPPRRAYFAHLLIDKNTFVRTEFYNDFLRPQGIYHALGGFVVRNGTQVFLCGVQRDLGELQFTMAEGRRLNRLFPHLERAAKLHGSLATAGGLTEGLAAALERLPQAAILVDGSGRIIWANHLGEEQLRRADGIRLRDGRVEAATCTSANQRLLRLIASAENVSAAGSEIPPTGPLVRTGLLEAPGRSEPSHRSLCRPAARRRGNENRRRRASAEWNRRPIRLCEWLAARGCALCVGRAPDHSNAAASRCG